jgi:hypothetical protein
MLVGGHSYQQEKCVLVDASDITKTMLKRTIHWFDDCPHCNYVMVLVGDNGSSPYESFVINTSGFNSDFLADMAQFYMRRCVVRLEDQK